MSEEIPTIPFRKCNIGFSQDQNRRLNWRNVDHADINQIVNV